MTFRLQNLSALEQAIAREAPLSATVAVLEAVSGPLGTETPEERAFSLAVEMGDALVAGVAIERIVARRSGKIPLSLKALWLKVASSLKSQDIVTTRSLLRQIAAYFQG